MKKTTLVSVIIGLVVLIVGFQNCGQNGDRSIASLASQLSPGPNPNRTTTTTRVSGSTSSSTTTTTQTGGSPAPKIDAACMTNPDYNACIFLKNPVAQNGSALSPAPSYSRDYTAIQTYAVNIAESSLSNSSFSLSVSGGSVATPNADATKKWKFTYANDPNHRVAQVMGWYWLNFQVQDMVRRTGKFYASNKGISVNVFDPSVNNNAYWSSSQNKVTMGVFNNITGSSGTSESALSAEIYCHEMGHGNIYYSNSAHPVDHPSSSTTNSSGNCINANGCIGGINEGQADFHSFLIFPNPPTALGETVFNSMSGLSECGVTRDITRNTNLQAASAFSACSGHSGEVHLMGRIYASIWYETWKAATAKGDVEKLFTEHLPLLTGSETIPSAVQKAMNLVTTLGLSSSISSQLSTELSRHGLSLP